MKRDNPTSRTWPNETAFTGRIAARIPLPLRDRLRAYVEDHNATTTECVIDALEKYLKERGY